MLSFVSISIADVTLIGGALLWSLVVGFITAISNIEMLSRELAWLRAIRGSLLYKLLNDYLAGGLLLMLLTLLPHLFDCTVFIVALRL